MPPATRRTPPMPAPPVTAEPGSPGEAPADRSTAAVAAPAGLPSSVQSVGMAFRVLEQLAYTPDAVGTSELARRLGETKARVHRHLSTLRELGFVEKDKATDGYRLGWKSYRLGMFGTENFGLRKIAHQHLLRLHHDSQQTAVLAMPAGAEVTVIDEIQSTGHVAITIRPGSLIPAASSALGRAILAFQPEPQRRAALAQPIPALTPDTPQSAERVARALDSVRERWYEVAVNERLPGIAALAAPIFDDRNQVVASVGVIGSHAVVTLPPPAHLLAQVQEAAARISAELRSTAWEQPRAAAADSGIPGAPGAPIAPAS
ncbi:MAG: IclR family transcriptional regulator [Comamonadaceae bacterium]|nr:MAG: IclR family transcriptional regulator [Comamonadaceae bacterium]